MDFSVLPSQETGSLLKFLAAWMLVLSFSLLAQRRLLSLIRLFAWQGVTLALSTVLVALLTGDGTLWISAAMTLLIKVFIIPGVLHRLLRRLRVRGDVEMVVNVPSTQLLGILLVLFSFVAARPLEGLIPAAAPGMLGIALAAFLLSLLMMITRRKAISQVVGFLSMDNTLFFLAVSATFGMPLIVELGIALDALIGFVILGVFFFQIRETFDTLDLQALEQLREE